MRRLFPILFCLLLSVSMTAQDVVLQDSITDACGTEHKFKAKQLIVPGALITAGAVGIAFHDKLGNWGQGHHTSVDDYIQYAPVAANLFLGCLGVNHKHNFVDRVMISATAYAVEVALVNGLKYTVREPRPGADNERNSFPSGHTATVFTGAELVRKEYGWGIGSAAYASNSHWCAAYIQQLSLVQRCTGGCRYRHPFCQCSLLALSVGKEIVLAQKEKIECR